jgi:hypothetical protein
MSEAVFWKNPQLSEWALSYQQIETRPSSQASHGITRQNNKTSSPGMSFLGNLKPYPAFMIVRLLAFKATADRRAKNRMEEVKNAKNCSSAQCLGFSCCYWINILKIKSLGNFQSSEKSKIWQCCPGPHCFGGGVGFQRYSLTIPATSYFYLLYVLVQHFLKSVFFKCPSSYKI